MPATPIMTSAPVMTISITPAIVGTVITQYNLPFALPVPVTAIIIAVIATTQIRSWLINNYFIPIVKIIVPVPAR